MKRTRIILNLIAIIYLIGCNEKSDRFNSELSDVTDSTIVINFKDISVESISMSSFIESVRYINLEFSEHAIMSHMLQIKNIDTLLYIMDSDGKLKCFHAETGKFIRDTYIKGRGPNEISALSDFEIDDKYLYLLDPNLNKIRTFDHSGNFHNEIRLDQRALSLKKRDNGTWLLALSPFSMDNSEQKYGIVICDSLFRTIGYQLRQSVRYSRHPYFENRENPLYFTPLFGRSIYEQINDTTFKMKYFLEMGPFFPDNVVPSTKIGLEEGIMYTYEAPIHNDNYLFQSFNCSKEKGLFGTLIINLANNKALFAKYVNADLDEMIDFSFSTISGYNAKTDEFFGLTNVIYQSDMDSEEFNDIQKMVRPECRKYLLKESPDHFNPSIFFIKMKKNIDGLK